MRAFLILLCLLPFAAHARLIINYDLNYSSQSSDSNNVKSDQSRVFHKVFIGGSLNDRKTFFFGWNINKWSSEGKNGTQKQDFSMLEMGPKLLWYLNENYNWFVNAEWNPYAKGDRKIGTVSEKTSGSSYGGGIGYRFRLSRFVGLGAMIQYQATNISEAKVGNNEKNVSDSISHVMPMLELSAMFK
ncbi:MAG: outer membrane beta-barrel protein [Bacteriovoracaceae bacterium]